MNQWYYSKNGKAQGPVAETEIGTAIKAGEINQLDLVFQVGGEEWQPVAQVEVFQSFFEVEEPLSDEVPPSTSQIIETDAEEATKSSKVEWVVLRKVKSDKGMEYKQLGPFTKEKVLEMLDQGEVLFTDYGWKKGLESWIPIQKLEPFKMPLPSSVPVETQIYEDGDVDSAKDAQESDMTSLTELIEIEKFQREKTQVMSVTQIREHWQDSTMTGMHREPEVSGDPSQLWSLEPPSESKEGEGDKQNAVVGGALEMEPSVQSPVRRKKQKVAEKPRSFNLTPWLAAGFALVLSSFFLYFSFTDSGEKNPSEEVADAKPSKTVSRQAPVPSPRKAREPKPEKNDSLSKIKKLQARLEELRSKAEKPKAKNERTLATKKAKKKRKEKKKVVKAKAKPPAKKKVAVKPKAKPAPKPKPKPKAKPKLVKKKGATVPGAVSGNHRKRSFYMQRDRKVLFYSSLEAERLVLELEANFKKHGKSRGKWQQFYSRWNRSAKRFLHPLLKRFPERSRKYAFPRQFSNFKKDHQVLLEYGQFFNGKALGRNPASPGKDMKKVFAKYQEQARNLGRR